MDKVIEWKIPQEDLAKFEKVWIDTKNKIIAGDYNHFIKISDEEAAHVRPKGKDASDLMFTPQGTYEKKKCFWISQSYEQEKIINSYYLPNTRLFSITELFNLSLLVYTAHKDNMDIEDLLPMNEYDSQFSLMDDNEYEALKSQLLIFVSNNKYLYNQYDSLFENEDNVEYEEIRNLQNTISDKIEILKDFWNGLE